MTDPRESNPNASGPQGLKGGMGVSSERTGPAGLDGAEATDGVRPTEAAPLPDDPPPEQAAGGPEENTAEVASQPHHPEKNPGHSHG